LNKDIQHNAESQLCILR